MDEQERRDDELDAVTALNMLFTELSEAVTGHWEEIQRVSRELPGGANSYFDFYQMRQAVRFIATTSGEIDQKLGELEAEVYSAAQGGK